MLHTVNVIFILPGHFKCLTFYLIQRFNLITANLQHKNKNISLATDLNKNRMNKNFIMR